MPAYRFYQYHPTRDTIEPNVYPDVESEATLLRILNNLNKEVQTYGYTYYTNFEIVREPREDS